MLNTIRSKQAVLIIAIVLLVGFLFTRNVKGLVKPKESAKQAAVAGQATNEVQLTIEDASATAKNLVSNATAKEITALETAYQRADSEEKITLAKQLADKWNDVEQPVPSALYLELVSNKVSTLKNWLATGGRSLQAFDGTRDTLIQSVMLQKANSAFTKALKLDQNSNDAKTGLGITIVNGMGAPMEGIKMLMDVVEKDPKNLRANMNLGMFANKSGQFDKAITRFNFIIKEIKVTPDAYLHLAFAYENLEQNKEAIDAYLNAKKLAANATLSNFIDKKVAELKNKR
jgi:tetratricopeptide (TPR) repeat protein